MDGINNTNYIKPFQSLPIPSQSYHQASISSHCQFAIYFQPHSNPIQSSPKPTKNATPTIPCPQSGGSGPKILVPGTRRTGRVVGASETSSRVKGRIYLSGPSRRTRVPGPARSLTGLVGRDRVTRTTTATTTTTMTVTIIMWSRTAIATTHRSRYSDPATTPQQDMTSGRESTASLI